MSDAALLVVLVIVVSLVGAWVSRRLLDRQVGWIRAIACALVVLLIGLPIVANALDRADVLRDGRVVVSDLAAGSILAVYAGWLLVFVLIAILLLELVWPSGRGIGIVQTLRGAVHRRDRARRYTKMLSIASRHGLAAYRGRRQDSPDDLPAALVGALNEAGPTFVKLGQMLASRDDVLPPALTTALATLQSDSTPLPWSEVRAVIMRELHGPIESFFASVDEEPLAAASVAQVHTASLLDGTAVVIKVQRPNARRQIATDLDIVETVASDLERRTDWARDYQLLPLVREFARSLREELDYRIELGNMQMLRSAIERSGISRVTVPRAYPELSTAQLMVQERASGVPLSRLPEGYLLPDEARAVADDILASVLDQIIARGVFHADPHPGNIVVDDDGRIALIDLGSVGIIEKSLRGLLLQLLAAVSNEDDLAATDIVLMLVTPPESGLDTAALQHDIGVVLTRVAVSAGRDDNLFRLLTDVLRRHRLGMPPALLLAFRALGLLEGTLRGLDPDYDMISRALERSQGLLLATISPASMLMTAQTDLALARERIRRAPRVVGELAASLQRGTLSVGLRAFDTPKERSWVDGIVGQLTTTLVGIALIIGGVMLGVSDSGPMFTDALSLNAFMGTLVALGGALLLVRILRVALRRRALE